MMPKLPFDIPQDIMQVASNIKLALFDVDGVLTDGRLYFGDNGEALKIFNALDGHGLKMLQNAGIAVAIITARKSLPLETRMDELGIKHVYSGVQNKLQTFNALIQELNIDAQHCSFTGDDVIDLEVMNRCGLSIAVDNAHFMVKHYANWRTPLRGGYGAVRSVCDVLLLAQDKYPTFNLD